MLPKVFGIQVAKLGVAALVFWAPRAMLAQLPDAPEPVNFPSQRTPTTSSGDADAQSGPVWSISGDDQAGAFASSSAPGSTYRSGFASAATSWELVFNSGPLIGQQQSLGTPGKQSLAPGFSVATAAQHPVPGAAPALQSPCPPNTCSVAQSIMCCGNPPSPFTRYLKSPDAVPLTARDNLRSAVKNIIDPFNLMTIAADAAIGVASDSHSVYGPGVDGIAKYAGVSLTEDMTGEFFGTFLIPSLVHQDPHYHREPFMPIRHRILHAITQVVWAQSYTGQPMFNYGNVVGGIATAAVSNTFVPGPGRQGFGSTASRLALAFAISPSGNLIEEFVPDIAHRINLRVVIFQRILNTVSLEESGVQ
ncbi:MAG: hypothetical protein WA708_07375 [Acidobacteriaceae bacterium]